MRHKETVAVTITLPRALHEAAQALAKKRECGNVSAVVRGALYREAGMSPGMELKEGAAAQIQEAEKRTEKYKVSRKGGGRAASEMMAAADAAERDAAEAMQRKRGTGERGPSAPKRGLRALRAKKGSRDPQAD